MPTFIVKHGPEANISSLTLQYGEIVSTDTGKLFVGDSGGSPVAVSRSPSETIPKALSATAAVGTEVSFARGDHVHPLPTASDIGAAASSHTHNYAAADHVHPVATDTVDGFMSAADKTKLDGLSSGSSVSPSTTTPKALGTAAVGTETNFSRGDHVHPLPTAAQIGASASNHTHSYAATSHTHSYLPTSGGSLTGAAYAHTATDYSTSRLRNIYAGTSDLTAGSSSLANGAIYLCYE